MAQILTKRVNVGTSSTPLVSANARRTTLRFEVSGANPVYFGKSGVTNGSTPATDGFRRAANGSLEFTKDDATLVQQAWFAAAGVGATDVTVLEGID